MRTDRIVEEAAAEITTCAKRSIACTGDHDDAGCGVKTCDALDEAVEYLIGEGVPAVGVIDRERGTAIGNVGAQQEVSWISSMKHSARPSIWYGRIPMLWLLLVLFIAIFIAVLRGGRLGNLAEIELRMWYLLVVGFLMQGVTELFPDDASWSRPVGVGLVLLSYLPILATIAANRTKSGMWLAGIGILMNFTVIAANGGMPVLQEAAQVAAASEGTIIIADYKHVMLEVGTRLPFLADVIPLRFLGEANVLSLGDVFLAVGLGRFLEAELRRPVRWFKHKAASESGSADRG